MKQPDWTKAPEGATHWDRSEAGKDCQWIKLDDDRSWQTWCGTGWGQCEVDSEYARCFVKRYSRTREQQLVEDLVVLLNQSRSGTAVGLAEAIIERYELTEKRK